MAMEHHITSPIPFSSVSLFFPPVSVISWISPAMFDQGLSRREKTKCSLDSGPTVHFVHTSDVGFENGGFTMIRRFTAVINVIRGKTMFQNKPKDLGVLKNFRQAQMVALAMDEILHSKHGFHIFHHVLFHEPSHNIAINRIAPAMVLSSESKAGSSPRVSLLAT